MSTATDIVIRDATLGRVTGEGIIKIDLELTWSTRSAHTVDHEPTAGYWKFSVMGSAWKRIDSPDCHTAGQIHRLVAQVGTADARELVKLWRRWHLNDMRAGCAHQIKPTKDEHGRTDLDSVPACEVSGYRYGSAWLVELIPDADVAAIRALADRLATLR